MATDVAVVNARGARENFSVRARRLERNVGRYEADDASAARAAAVARVEALQARADALEEQLVAAVRAIEAPPHGVDTFPRTKAALYPLVQALLCAKRAAAGASPTAGASP